MLSHKVENRLAEEQFANKYAKKLQRTHKRVQKEIDTIFAKAQKNGKWSRKEIYKYNRAKKLKSTIREQLGKYKGNFAKEFRDDLANLYKNETRWMQNFLKKQKGLGIAYENLNTGLPVQAVKSEVVDNIMIKGKTMTEYVGKYGDDVAFKVEQEVMDSIMLGEHPSQTTARLNKLTNKMQNRVDMTVRSWTNAVWNKSNLDVYEQAHIKKVRYLATFDEKTCSECAELHNNVYKIGDEPSLPLHPYCRCAYAPYISEELTPSANDMPVERTKKAGDKIEKRNILGESRDCKIRNVKNTELIQPVDLDYSKQKIEFDELENLYKEMPEKLTENVDSIVLFDGRNPWDDYWEKEYGIENFKSFATAGDGQISFYSNGNITGAKAQAHINPTLYHEAGHELDKALVAKGRFSTSYKWKKAIKYDDI